MALIIITFYLFAALDKLNVTLVTNNEGWKIAVTDQLLTGLAEEPLVRLSGLVPTRTPELIAWAEKLNIKLFTPKPFIGYSDKDLLAFPPNDLDIDVLISYSYGIDLGRQAQVIKDTKKCKWAQVVHTISEELAKFGKKEIHDSEHDVQLKLCEHADMIIAVGPKVAEAYKNYMAYFSDKFVFDLTPEIDHDLMKARRLVDHGEIFRIMVSATNYEKFFEAKGIDIAAQAIALLQDTSYNILFLVKPDEDPKVLESIVKDLHLSKTQFTVNQIKKDKQQLKMLLSRVQLAISPARAVGFGTTILSALSANVPVLVGGNTGLGVALKKLPSGTKYIIDSDVPKVWADKIRELRQKGAVTCSVDAEQLRKEYMEKYNKQEQCQALVKKMWEMFPGKQGNEKLMNASVVDRLRQLV